MPGALGNAQLQLQCALSAWRQCTSVWASRAANGTSRPLSTFSTASPGQRHSALYVADADNWPMSHAPFMLGLLNYLRRHIPRVGLFVPMGPNSPDSPLGRHVELLEGALAQKEDPRVMSAVTVDEASRLISAGKAADLLDRIYASFVAYKERHDLVVVQGASIGGTEVDAQIAGTIAAPVLLAMKAGEGPVYANELFNRAMLKRQTLARNKVDMLGVVISSIPAQEHAIVSSQLRQKFQSSGVNFCGSIPDDPLLNAVRLDEVQVALNAEQLFGSSMQLDQEFDYVIVGSQRMEELLEMLQEESDRRPLIVTSVDRMDIVLGLLASQVSVQGPVVAGIVLTPASPQRLARNYARSTAHSIFAGMQRSNLYQGSLMPVLSTEMQLYDAIGVLDRMGGTILPTSARKISHCNGLFDKFIDANSLVASLEQVGRQDDVITPKMFMHSIKSACLKTPQTIVLPEALDKRILTAASEVTQRGLAKVVLLGDATAIQAEAKKLAQDISKCTIVDPKTYPHFDRMVDALVEARKAKGLPRDSAVDMIANDPNMFGVMMVRLGDADGMVSGAIHTTAATIRPAMQVLKADLVSSVFFMCLPDKVLVYGDCAVNVNPSSQELSRIAIASADTAKAFGIEPRVAMLSYSTLGSGAGPDVQKVTDAVKLVKEQRPDLKVEGPIQYDAAVDPVVAAVKIKTASEVAGKANVLIFPDLNTGNNTYKAVQQASNAIAMGPVMQGLRKPVNDLSRGCTVPDIVNTICATSVQAMQKAQAAKAVAGVPQ